MDLDGLVESATLERMRRAASGEDVRRMLRIASLRPGDVGVLRARVASVAPARTFRRKNGTEGLVGRVTFDDGTGEVDGVLWDDLNRLKPTLQRQSPTDSGPTGFPLQKCPQVRFCAVQSLCAATVSVCGDLWLPRTATDLI